MHFKTCAGFVNNYNTEFGSKVTVELLIFSYISISMADCYYGHIKRTPLDMICDMGLCYMSK